MLLDEPTNHLDIRHQHETLALLRALPASVVVVLHDLNLAARYCDHLVMLDRGDVVAAGLRRPCSIRRWCNGCMASRRSAHGMPTVRRR
jgi:ABC-type cobalamin/Fe3+-siderophores transport system ATPase subunit